MLSSEIDCDLNAETYLKKLIGRQDVEAALQRLDQWTQEEARMAAVETLTITRCIDDKVLAVEDKVKDVSEKVKGVYEKVKDVGEDVKGVGEKVKNMDDN